jgi:hypothetical protein
MLQALPAAVSAAAAATELLSRVQASLTAGFSAGALPWPAAPAPLMSLPASTVDLLLAAPAAAKPSGPVMPAAPDLQAPHILAAGAPRQSYVSGSNTAAAAPTAMVTDTADAQMGTFAEPQQ